MHRLDATRHRRDSGFSFVELLAALAILALLAAVAIPVTLTQRDAGNEAIAKQDLTLAVAEIDTLIDTWNGIPPAQIAIATQGTTWTATQGNTPVATGPVSANTSITGTIWTDGSYALLSTRSGSDSNWLYRSDTEAVTNASALPTAALGSNGTAPSSSAATAPEAPATVDATSTTAGTVTVTWAEVAQATSYIVRIDGVAPATIPAGTLTATLAGAPAGSVEVTVFALNGTTQSPGTNTTVNVAATTTDTGTRPIWTNLPISAGWANWVESNQGATQPLFNTAGYTKVRGIVKLKGTLVSTTGTATALGTLPPGYRPDYDLTFAATSTAGSSTIRINRTGEVFLLSAITAGSFISLDSIIFPAAGTATWTTVTTFGSGFAAVGTAAAATGPGPVRYWKDPDGLVWLGGAVSVTGTPVDNATIFTLPTGSRSWSEAHLRASGYTSAATPAPLYATIGAVSAGSVRWKAGSPTGGSRVSLDGAIIITADANNATNSATGLQWTRFATYAGTTAWTNYNAASFTTGAYAVTSSGMVILQGLLATGTTGSPARIQYLPPQLATAGRQIRAAVSNNAHARLDIEWGAGSTAIGPYLGTTWFSLDGHAWFPAG
jgi:prepilin-type N-terminal cleavage/methylation domain-containing protein